jgi:transcriptional regulator with XRE-family HTH domain
MTIQGAPAEVPAADEEGSIGHRIALHVGARIRERRIMVGMSAAQLAARIGVTQQQQHKYERGLNQISAGRLYEIACVLGVSPAHFFEELDMDLDKGLAGQRRSLLELVRHFQGMADSRYQEALARLAQAMAVEERASAPEPLRFPSRM